MKNEKNRRGRQEKQGSEKKVNERATVGFSEAVYFNSEVNHVIPPF